MNEATPEAKRTQGLDEVLLAMDVVDTLRHREEIMARHADRAGREEDLVQRLKEIYAAQGMEVPDRIIRDGVKALEEKRFAYTPTEPGPMRRLAIIYITRERWLKPVLASAAVLIAGWGAWQVGVVMPREARAAAIETQLTDILPRALENTHAAVRVASDDEAADAQADALRAQGLEAAAARDRAGAEAALAALERLERDLEAVYQVRIVNEPGEMSGVFRIDDTAPGVRNYYLIVEAVDATGRVLEVPVTSEEDRSRARVTRWGQRVSEAVFNRVAADKSDDLIIQAAIIGDKPAGRLAPVYGVDTPGGAILEW